MAASLKIGPEMFSEPTEKRKFRLHQSHINDLRDVARGCDEGDAGIRTRYLVDLAASAGLRDVGDVHLFDAEKWIDSRYEYVDHLEIVRPREMHARRKRCMRAILSMLRTNEGHAHVGALLVVYGEEAPLRRRLRQGPIDAKIAKEEKKKYAPPHEADRHELGVAKELLDRLGDELYPLARFTDAVEAHRQEMISEAAARGIDRGISDRRLTSTDAIRHALAPATGRRADEDPDHFRVRVQAREDERAFFLTCVSTDASSLLTAASLAYQAAWQRS